MSQRSFKLAQRTYLLGVAVCFLAVLVGAFGAHGLREVLESNNRVATFATASEYHFYHGLGLLFIGVLVYQGYSTKMLAWASWIMFSGTLVFSGSLYILSISNQTWLGAVTPLGGVLLLLAWGLCGFSVINRKT